MPLPAGYEYQSWPASSAATVGLRPARQKRHPEMSDTDRSPDGIATERVDLPTTA